MMKARVVLKVRVILGSQMCAALLYRNNLSEIPSACPVLLIHDKERGACNQGAPCVPFV